MKALKPSSTGRPILDLSKQKTLSKYAIEEAKTANRANQQFLLGILKIANKLKVMSDVSLKTFISNSDKRLS